jgi:hypothetical protein
MGWLLEAEETMPDIFKAGSTGSDAKAMEEIWHFVLVGKEVPEHKIVKFASERIPAHSVMRVIANMERAGMIEATSIDKRNGTRNWKATVTI